MRSGEVKREVARQYELFLQKAGRRPDFIDGHLHAHQLPGVREGVLAFVLELPPGSRPYLRNTRMSARELRGRGLPWLKTALVGAFGARMFDHLQNAGLKTNEGFAGIYNFSHWRRYPQYLPRFADSLAHPNGILVVHPGEAEEWRRQELAALRQFPFPEGSLNNFRA